MIEQLIGIIATVYQKVYSYLDPVKIGYGVVLSNNNLTATFQGQQIAMSLFGKTAGKWYWEVTIGNNGGTVSVGVGTINTPLSSVPGSTAASWVYLASNGNKVHNGTSSAYGATLAAGDVVGVKLDVTTGTLEFLKNNVSQGVAYNTGLAGVGLYPIVGSNGVGTDACTVNFGASAFTYSVPGGYNSGFYS